MIPIHSPVPRVIDPTERRFLAGWQARDVFDAPSSPKYLSMRGMRKSELLYGLPEAKMTTDPVVVVEGPTDVWRLGTNVVATIGKSLSNVQLGLLISHFPGRPLVVGFDSDAGDESRRALDALVSKRREFRDASPVIRAAPPEGVSDFGDCTREQAWEHIVGVTGYSLV